MEAKPVTSYQHDPGRSPFLILVRYKNCSIALCFQSASPLSLSRCDPNINPVLVVTIRNAGVYCVHPRKEMPRFLGRGGSLAVKSSTRRILPPNSPACPESVFYPDAETLASCRT